MTPTNTVCGTGARGGQDGTGTNAQFNHPYAIAVTRDATTAFVTDSLNHKIRRIELKTGTVSTLAGGEGGAVVPGAGGGLGGVFHVDGRPASEVRLAFVAGVALSLDEQHLVFSAPLSLSLSLSFSLSPSLSVSIQHVFMSQRSVFSLRSLSCSLPCP